MIRRIALTVGLSALVLGTLAAIQLISEWLISTVGLAVVLNGMFIGVGLLLILVFSWYLAGEIIRTAIQ